MKDVKGATTQFLINSLVQNGSNNFPGSSQQVHGFATDVITGSAVVAAASAATQWHSCFGRPAAFLFQALGEDGGRGAVVLCCVQGLLEAFRSSYMQLRVGLSQQSPRSSFNS